MERNPASVIHLSGILRAALPFFCLAAACTTVEAPGVPKAAESAALKRIRQVFARIPQTLAKNHKTFMVSGGTVRGFGAGEAYPQIWLRDSAWIVPAAAAYYEADTLTSWLDLHLSVAEKNGRLRDWVAAAPPDTFREWAPRVAGVGPIAVDTNSNESDQEPSAALAYCRARESLQSRPEEGEPKHAARFAELVRAVDALVRDRTDKRTGLIWSGLTADWGDVSPLYPDQRAIYLDGKTPRTLALYSNVMVYAALDCLAGLDGGKTPRAGLLERARLLRDRIRTAFWMKDRGYFRIRQAMDAVPEAFRSGDDDRFALGGNALAVLLGVADDDQARAIFEVAERLRIAHGFSTISTVLVPPYAEGVFQHPSMREPSQYQNGGQWDWYGAALVQAEFERGHTVRARAHLDQIVARILRGGPGVHEWYAQDGSPRGSAAYAAAAAALHNAVTRGLFGLAPSAAGHRVIIRTGETLLPFEIPGRAAAASLTLSQTVSASSIDVTVRSTTPLREICTVLPPGASPAEPAAAGLTQPRSVRRVGDDTIACADVSSLSSPFDVRFALSYLGVDASSK